MAVGDGLVGPVGSTGGSGFELVFPLEQKQRVQL